MPGALFFVTGNVEKRRPIFKIDEYCRAFFDELQNLRTTHQLKLVTFVLMFDHFHFLLNPKGGDIQTHTGILKSFTARRIVKLAPPTTFWNGKENRVWQESFKSLPLWSKWMVNQKINYIHANPVKARLCSTAEDYKWSSFRSFYRVETDPLLAVDKVWWWEGDEERVNAAVREMEEKRNLKLEEEVKARKEKALQNKR